MKKISGIIAAIAVTFSLAFGVAVPAYAATNDCPSGSFQGYAQSGNKYLTTDATDAEKQTVTKLENVSVTSDGKISGATFSSVAQCNMNGHDLKGSNLMGTVNTIVNVILGVLGIVAVVVIILGGVQYATSAGDPGKVKKAKDTILYGIIGLMVALLAFAIVNFILSSVWG